MGKQPVKLRLTQTSVDDMIRRLSVFESNIEVACEEIVEEIVTKGEQIAREFDSIAPNTGNNDYTFTHDTFGSNNNKGYVAMSGPDSVYVEFGTGDVGANSPHPLHNTTPGISPYNSGPTIRLGDNGHYWFAPPEVMTFMSFGSGYYKSNRYTQGIPAGCQMYNTSNELKNIAPEIAKKYISKTIRSRVMSGW